MARRAATDANEKPDASADAIGPSRLAPAQQIELSTGKDKPFPSDLCIYIFNRTRHRAAAPLQVHGWEHKLKGSKRIITSFTRKTESLPKILIWLTYFK
jgi:hypothetical protein